MAADRLCPARVLGGARSDEGDGGPTVTLSRAVALCEEEDLDPSTGPGRFLLVLGIRHEVRNGLLLLAAFPEEADRAEIERDARAWLDGQTAGVEDGIAEWWGEPVAGLIRQQREQPGFFDRVLAERVPDRDPCPSARM
jgi:hypothetical protein